MSLLDVVYDLGHGGKDSGATGNGLQEKVIVLEVGKVIDRASKRCNLNYAFTRLEDKYLTLDQRTNFANSKGAKCLISIHNNSAENTSAQGIETFAYNDKVKDLATILHEELIKTGAYTKNRGVKTANFHMLRESNMRAALTELAFISNAGDAALLKSKTEIWGEAIVKAACRYVGKPYIAPNTSTSPAGGDKQLYRICATAVTGKVAADAEVEKLKAKGYKDAYKMPV